MIPEILYNELVLNCKFLKNIFLKIQTDVSFFIFCHIICRRPFPPLFFVVVVTRCVSALMALKETYGYPKIRKPILQKEIIYLSPDSFLNSHIFFRKKEHQRQTVAIISLPCLMKLILHVWKLCIKKIKRYKLEYYTTNITSEFVLFLIDVHLYL